GAGFDVEGFSSRSNAARHETRPIRVAARELVGHTAGNFGRRFVHLEDMVLQAELRHPYGCGVECARLDDVRPGLQIGAVNLFDEGGLSEHQSVGAILERHAMIPEARTAIIVFGWLPGKDERAHRAVEYDDAAGHQLFKEGAGGHVSDFHYEFTAS